jgi:hypothetical protein
MKQGNGMSVENITLLFDKQKISVNLSKTSLRSIGALVRKQLRKKGEFSLASLMVPEQGFQGFYLDFCERISIFISGEMIVVNSDNLTEYFSDKKKQIEAKIITEIINTPDGITDSYVLMKLGIKKLYSQSRFECA